MSDAKDILGIPRGGASGGTKPRRGRAATAKRLREATAPSAAAVADAFGAFDDDAILERPFVPCAPAALKAALVDSAVGACLARFVLDECARRGYRARVLDAGSSRFDRRGKTVPLCVVSLSLSLIHI